jgi:geranylgeranyl pyrophosphate synthase
MRFTRLKSHIRSVPEIAAWPEMIDLIERAVHREWQSVWDYPVAACEAVGGDAEAALPGAAAVFCSMASIHLVDDMLDDDPKGDYHRLGTGPVANMALAFQAAGHRLLDDPALAPETRAALQASFARMSLGTAFGQGLDARELSGEEEYWKVVEAKTPPLFGAAFHIGALLGGASPEVAGRIERVGRVLGRFIQVSDDMSDSLKSPAGADWSRRTNNLPILYAMTADHPERERFLEMSVLAGDPEILEAAQKILLRSGAVSYCAFKMIEFSQEAADLLASTPLHDPRPIERLLAIHRRPLDKLLESVGLTQPAALPV